VSEISIDELVGRLDELTVIDVRAASEYDGSLGAPCDPRQGHIPGARHHDLAELSMLDGSGLRALLALPEGSEVVAYCHSGSRSAIAVELLRGAGFAARNYRGSWHEWSRSDQPIADAPGS
jgi:thiosulfate/3-mercaptopyruvate sulfurtransferase